MNPIKAKQLLDLLHLNVKDSSISSQLNTLFIPSPFQKDTVYLRDSWKGHLISWIQLPWKKTAYDLEVQSLFARAVATLAAENTASLRNYGFRIVEFYKESLKKKPLASASLQNGSFTRSPEVQEFETTRQNSIREEKENIARLSLLRSISAEERKEVNAGILQSLFSLNDGKDIKVGLRYLERFLAEHPEYGVPFFQEKIRLLREALTLDRQLIEEVIPSGVSLPLTERMDKMRNRSTQLVQAIHQLARSEKKIFFFSYGNLRPTLQSIFLKLNQLPESSTKILPEPIKECLAEGKIPDAQKLADEMITQFFGTLRKGMRAEEKETSATPSEEAGGDSIENDRESDAEFLFGAASTQVPEGNSDDHSMAKMLFGYLFADPERGNSSNLVKCLPDVFESYLEHVLQDGVLGNVSHFISQPQLKSTLRWIAENGPDLFDQDQREEILAKIEKQLTLFIHHQIETKQSEIQKQFSEHLQKVQNIVPGAVIELAGLDWLLLSGPLWIEFGKDEDGTFSTAIYSLGTSLAHHPQNYKTGLPYCVLRLKDIDPERVNTDFIYAMLTRHLEPYCNSETTCNSHDIYSGPIEMLKGNLAPNSVAEDAEIGDRFPASSWRMMQTMLFCPATPRKHPVFEMHLEGLLNFCQPYLTGENQSFVIPDMKVCRLIQNAVGEIKKELKFLKTAAENSMRISRIEATLKELEQAVQNFLYADLEKTIEVKINPRDIFAEGRPQQAVRTLFDLIGVSSEFFEGKVDFVSWAFGDEIGQYFKDLLNGYKDLIPEKTTKVKSQNKTSKSEFEGKFFGSHLLIYWQIARKLTNVILLGLGVYHGGIWNLLDLPLIISILPYVLPPSVMSWLRNVLIAVSLRLAKMMVQLIWNLNFGNNFKQDATRLGTEIKGEIDKIKTSKEVSFTLQTPIPLAPGFSSENASAINDGIPLFRPHYFKLPSVSSTTSSKLPMKHIPRLSSNISSKELKKRIRGWLTNQTIQLGAKREAYLVKQILSLDPPSLDGDSMWDRVEDPLEFMDLLTDLSLDLMIYKSIDARAETLKKQMAQEELGNTQQTNGEKTKKEKSEELNTLNKNVPFIVAMYQIQAILLCLARKCPDAHIKEQQIYAAGLRTFYAAKGLVIEDPELLERLEGLNLYLLPDFVLEQKYEMKEFFSKQKNRLFYYEQGYQFIDAFRDFSSKIWEDPLDIGKPPPVPSIIDDFNQGKLKRISKGEREYLKVLAADPKTSARLKDLGFTETLTEHQKMLVLFQESLVFTRKNPLLPRAFTLLKLQTLLCQSIGTLLLREETEPKLINPKDLPPPEYPKNCSMRKPKAVWKISYNENDYSMLTHLTKFPWLNGFKSQKIIWTWSESPDLMFPEHCREEAAVLEKPKSRLWDALETGGKEISERILHYINFIKEEGICKYVQEIDFRIWLDSIFFAPGALKQQILKSPQSVQMFGELFNELIEQKYIEKFLWSIDLGIRIKRFCCFYHPESKAYFPDFTDYLEKIPTGNVTWRHKKRLQAMHAISLGFPGEANQEEEKQKTLSIFLDAWFDGAAFSSEEKDEYQRLIPNFMEAFSRWLPIIENDLKDQTRRNEILDDLVKKRGIAFEGEGQIDWSQAGDWKFEKNGVLVDFEDGSIKLTNSSNGKKICLSPEEWENIKSQIKTILGINESSLKIINDRLFRTKDGRFEAEVVLSGNEKIIVLREVIEGVVYEYISAGNEEIFLNFKSNLIKNLKAQLNTHLLKNILFWVEKTEQPVKKLLIQSKGNLNNFTILTYNPEHPEELIDLPTAESNSSSAAKDPVIVPTDLILSQIKPLTRFCPAKKIVAKAYPGDPYISHLCLKEQNLNFNFYKSRKGEIIGKSKEFSDFHIAKCQEHSALKGMTSYLILENGAGKKKVLLSQKQYIHSIFTRFLFLTGPAERFVQDQLAALNENLAISGYVELDIYEGHSGGSRLGSGDPEKLGHLLLFYIIQGKKQAAEEICKELERIYRSQKVPSYLWNTISLLALVPIEIEGIGYLRRRLFSALEQNHHLFPDSSSAVHEKDGEQNPFKFGSETAQFILVAATALWDLNSHINAPDPRQPLTTNQEFFLFKCVYRHLGVVFRDKLKLPKKVLDFVEEIGWDTIIEAMCITPGLSQRYRQLKENAGIQDTMISSLVQLASRAISAPSGIPALCEGKPVRYTATLWNNKGGVLGAIIETFSRFRDQRWFDLKALRLRRFYREMDPWIEPSPNMNPQTLTALEFKKNFSAHYALARGDFPFKQEEYPEHFIPTQEDLIRLLTLKKGGWDRQTQVLMLYLEAIILYPTAFPDTHDLIVAHMSTDTGADKAEFDKRHPRWGKFFEELNARMFETYFLSEFVDPLYKYLFHAIGTDRVLAAIRDQLMPPQFFSYAPTSQFAEMGSKAVTDMAWDPMLDAGTSLRNEVGGIGRYFIKNKITRWDVARAAKHVLITAGAVYGTVYLAGTATAEVTQSFCEASSGMLSAAECTAARTHELGSSLYIYAVAGVAKYFLAKKMDRNLGWRQVLPMPIFTVPAMHVIGKIYHAYTQKTKIETVNARARDQIVRLSVSFSSLKTDDQIVNTFLDQLFNLAFKEEKGVLNQESDLQSDKESDALELTELEKELDSIEEGLNQPEVEVKLFQERPSDSPVVKDRIKRVNDSIKAFYQKADPNPTYYILKDTKALIDIYIRLQSFYSIFSQHVEEEKSKLLGIFNTTKFGFLSGTASIGFLDLVTLVENNSLGLLVEDTGLSNLIIPKLELAIARIDHKTSRLQQVERLLKIMDEISKASSNVHSSEYWEKVEQLAIELKIRPAINLDSHNQDVLRRNLRFQAGSGHMLWEQQVKKGEMILSEIRKDVAFEAQPGVGKTHYVIPAIAVNKLDGNNLVMIISPKQLAGDNQSKFSIQLRSIYNKASHVLSFKRENTLYRGNLEALLGLMTNAKEEREVLQLTKEDPQTLRALLDARLFDYFFKDKGKNYEEKRCLILLHKALSLMYTKGIAVIDEAHEIYRFRHQLNFTIGSSKTIDNDFYIIMEAVARVMIRDPELCGPMQNNKLYTIDKERYEKVIKPRIAEILSKDLRFKIKKNKQARAEFIEFVCDLSEEIPLWITSDLLLYQQISIVKGMLNVLFPMNFKNIASVHYMASQKGNGEFARPSDGNSHVVEQNSIQSPYETLMKTMLMLFANGLNEDQFEKFLAAMAKSARKEMEAKKILYDQTFIYRKFKDDLVESLLFSTTPRSSNPFYFSTFDALRKNLDACLLYVRHCIKNEIRYWTQSIQVTSHDFAMMFHQISCTGTPYNDGTYPDGIKMILDPTTMGELLHIIHQKCSQDRIHILKSNEPTLILKEILKTYFKAGSKFSAIIDGGALFTGKQNEEVAKAMMDHCNRYRPDIEGIKFYKDDEQLYCFVKNETEPRLAATLEKEPKKCLTYYDQRHGFGSDIKQSGDGLETVGPDHPLFRLVQELFRIRDLKKQQKLKQIEDLILKMPVQNIHLCLTKDVQRMILGYDPDDKNLRTPTLHEILNYAVRNEAAIGEEENYPATGKKIFTTSKKAIYHKIMMTPSEQFSKWSNVWKEFKDIFITNNEDDPSKIFGLLRVTVDPKKVLKATKKQALALINNSRSFKEREKKQVKKNLKELAYPVLTEQVVASKQSKEGKLEIAPLDVLEITQTIETNVEQTKEHERQEESQNESQQELQNQQESQQCQSRSRFHYQEIDWPKIEDETSVNWLIFSTPEVENVILSSWTLPFLGMKKQKTCPFYTVRSLLESAGSQTLQVIAPYFDQRLWLSNNFVVRKKYSLLETASEIGSKHQFGLHEVLVHFMETEEGIKILYVGPLSVRDSVMWRKKLTPNPIYWKEKEVKVVLWDVHSRTIQAGYPIAQANLRNNDDFNLLIGQLKILDGTVDVIAEKGVLCKWLKEIDAEKIQDAFEEIHKQRGKQTYSGSIVEDLFIEAIPERPYEEKI